MLMEFKGKAAAFSKSLLVWIIESWNLDIVCYLFFWCLGFSIINGSTSILISSSIILMLLGNATLAPPLHIVHSGFKIRFDNGGGLQIGGFLQIISGRLAHKNEALPFALFTSLQHIQGAGR
jgi:hypothetical protein